MQRDFGLGGNLLDASGMSLKFSPWPRTLARGRCNFHVEADLSRQNQDRFGWSLFNRRDRLGILPMDIGLALSMLSACSARASIPQPAGEPIGAPFLHGLQVAADLSGG